jgi:hypothetical protein
MEMANDNRTWGAERMRGELLKLGVVVTKRTIQKYMRMARKGTSPGGQAWSTFLKNHAHEIWSCDFVQTYDLRFRQIFAFVIVKHVAREVVYHAVTYYPTQESAAQQRRNATFDGAPRFLIRDGDGKFGALFDDVAIGSDIEVIRSLHPNMHAQCERFMLHGREACAASASIMRCSSVRSTCAGVSGNTQSTSMSADRIRAGGKASRLARTMTTLRAPESSLLSRFWLASTTTIDERPRDVS